MHLSKIGNIAEDQWRDISNHYKDIGLGEFIVMPNHLHGIIHLLGPEWEPKIAMHRKKTLQESLPKAGSISNIVRCYKAGVTRWCKENSLSFGWQLGFHDRIVRGPNSLSAVREYIRDNPINWDNDEHNPQAKKA